MKLTLADASAIWGCWLVPPVYRFFPLKNGETFSTNYCSHPAIGLRSEWSSNTMQRQITVDIRFFCRDKVPSGLFQTTRTKRTHEKSSKHPIAYMEPTVFQPSPCRFTSEPSELQRSTVWGGISHEAKKGVTSQRGKALLSIANAERWAVIALKQWYKFDYNLQEQLFNLMGHGHERSDTKYLSESWNLQYQKSGKIPVSALRSSVVPWNTTFSSLVMAKWRSTSI